MLAGWGVCACLLVYLQRRLHARYGIAAGLHPNPTTRELLIFALRRVGAVIVAFLAALTFVRVDARCRSAARSGWWSPTRSSRARCFRRSV